MSEYRRFGIRCMLTPSRCGIYNHKNCNANERVIATTTYIHNHDIFLNVVLDPGEAVQLNKEVRCV